ncbi:uncharacterized protein [Rutidosis leptorrhynchoides]|uniref:uncharacterized protein n=1 Tax=Rutidosis leptorrhynchoides TaxID=125765 RepID=UPI003A995054
MMKLKQKLVYDLITRSSYAKSTELIFVYGHGGTGKTFLWKAIITALRARGKIVLAVASSGIASLLFPSGQTAHSRIKLPMVLTDELMCNVKKNTQMAKLLQKTDLIMWDEAPMNNRRCFEALDRSLRDILDNNDVVFGGMSVILGGDFKQTLPIKKKGRRKIYWMPPLLAHICGSPDEQDPENARWVKIPDEYCIPDNEDGLANLISFIYPRESLQNPTAVELQQKAIACPKNDAADAINKTIVDMVDGPIKTYHSLDTATPHGNDGCESELLYPVKYLNTLNFPCLLPHALELKIGVPAILLRNVNVGGGLCNGTRMIVTQLLSKSVECEIITGTRVGQKVFLPRMGLVYKDSALPYILKRQQLPIKLSYAMIINKSHGQSISKIGVYLSKPIFGHGQLYVALSRATSRDGLRLLIKEHENQGPNMTNNIVYSDFLLTLCDFEIHLRIEQITPLAQLPSGDRNRGALHVLHGVG